MTPQTQPGPLIPLDWAAAHGPVSAPISLVTTASAVVSVGTLAHMPPLVPLCVGTAAALGHGVWPAVRGRLDRATAAARAAAWAASSAWCAVALATDPRAWDVHAWWTAIGSLTCIAIGAGAALAHAHIVEDARAAAVTQSQTQEDPLWEAIDVWVEHIRVVTGRTVTSSRLRHREDDSGFTMEVELPKGSRFTLSDLQGYAMALAEVARLPQGCTVRIGPAAVQGHAILEIDTRPPAVIVDHPMDLGRLSVNGPVPWGHHNGVPVCVLMREACALILGPPGAGKSTLLDNVMTGFARCDDVLVWGIDLGKGGAAFSNWAAGPRPVMDWIAGTPEEALAMLEAADAVSDARIPAYKAAAEAAGLRGLLQVNARMPEIVIVVDEGAEALSDGPRNPVATRLNEIIRTDREAGIRVVLTATSGNLDVMGTSQVRANAPLRVALTSTDSEGTVLRKLFPGLRGIDQDQLRAPGSGVIGQSGAFSPTTFRSWRITAQQITQIIETTRAYRASLDLVSAAAAGPAYANRHQGQTAVAASGAATTPAGPAPADTAPRAFRALNLHQAPRPAEQEQMEREMAAFLDSLGDTAEPQPPQPPTPRREWLVLRVVEAVRLAGAEGIGPLGVAKSLGLDESKRDTVRAALKMALEDGDLTYRARGAHSVYIHRKYATEPDG